MKVILRMALTGITLLVITSGPGGAAAQETGPQAPLFADHDVLHIRIEGPLDALTGERSNTDYYDGTLSYTDQAGALHALDIGFRTRGNYRRRKETCWFPPVRLNFKEKQTEGTLFEGQDKLKLVTHCHPRNLRYEQYLIKEYLAYRILALHTPYAFEARLLRITWVNTDDGESFEKYGFLIEDEGRMARRLAADTVDLNSVSYDSLDRRQAAIASMFEYLIGNTDFSLVKAVPDEPCCHNAILLTQGGERYLPVPYDFDFSGLVNAPYAEPNPNLGIKNVRVRLYRGTCVVNDQLPDTIELFRDRQSAVLDLVSMQEGLDDSMRKNALRFLGDFYGQISNPAAAAGRFARDCN